MGRVNAAPSAPAAIELPLPWGPVVRGVRWGAGSDVVTLLHEPGADLDAWGVLPACLAHKVGMTVVAFDLPGHGLSDDPWAPGKTGEVVRLLCRTAETNPGPVSPTEAQAPTWRKENESAVGHGSSKRQFVIAAGSVATNVLGILAEFPLAGVILLSPSAPEPMTTAAATRSRSDPGKVREQREGTRAPVPRLFFAGSLAGNDLEIARRLAAAGTGWAAVTSIPASERGTGLLTTPWRPRIEEEIVAFLRDCLRRNPPRAIEARPAPPMPR